MSRLSQNDLQQLEAQLLARERELRADVAREIDEREDYQRLAGEAADAGDDSNADLIRDLRHADIGRDLQELRQVQDALSRIHGDEYGLCIDCGNDIPLARLRAEPAALRCVDCQSRHEREYAGSPRAPSL